MNDVNEEIVSISVLPHLNIHIPTHFYRKKFNLLFLFNFLFRFFSIQFCQEFIIINCFYSLCVNYQHNLLLLIYLLYIVYTSIVRNLICKLECLEVDCTQLSVYRVVQTSNFQFLCVSYFLQVPHSFVRRICIIFSSPFELIFLFLDYIFSSTFQEPNFFLVFKFFSTHSILSIFLGLVFFRFTQIINVNLIDILF